MSLHAEPAGPIPEETVRVARAAFPHGSPYLQRRDVLDTLYDDARFAPLFAARGRQRTVAFREVYAARAGCEGTLSQAVPAFGLRRAR